MVISPVLRQLQMDNISLREYSIGILPEFDDIKRRLFLNERLQNPNLPDHYYLNAGDYSLENIEDLATLVTAGISGLADQHLELINDRIFIKTKALCEWQKLVTFCSPLLCISSLLWEKRFPFGERNPRILIDFVHNYIYYNCRFTSITSPYFPQINNSFEPKGFSDLHIHLNGSTETDEIWQNFLRHPRSAFLEVMKQYQSSDKTKRNLVKQQFEQEDNFLDPMGFYFRLKTAQRIRRYLVHLLFAGKYTPSLNILDRLKIPVSYIISSDSLMDSFLPESNRHPLRALLEGTGLQYRPNMDRCLEALLYILVIDEIAASKCKTLAGIFHYYLLILGFINRFVVQQTIQIGFEQFQLITLNGFRNNSEKDYESRFYQMHGNDLTYLDILEGRFSPQNTPLDNIVLVKKILASYTHFQKQCTGEGKDPFKLQLIAHFIKQRDIDDIGDDLVIKIRHRNLRKTLWLKGKALASILNYKDFKNHFRGVDAAANELHTPPEVFASVFRMLRRKGVNNFTFHAGEDFHHLIGGLRAIFEVITFLDFKPGNRIGHATAAGINPELWLKRINEEIYLSKGEWLDDLIFAHHIISEDQISKLNGFLPQIKNRIELLAEELYGNYYSLLNLTQAWLLRKYNPIYFLYSYSLASSHPTWCLEEWSEVQKIECSPTTRELIQLYHTSKYRKQYKQKIRISPKEIFESAEQLMLLQNLLLKLLHDHEIILEVLPTSNIRISYYRDYDEHHLWRWLGIESEKNNNNPPVVLGTDDPGIFATNIFNEYCHVYNYLTNKKGMNHTLATKFISELVQNSKNYHFR